MINLEYPLISVYMPTHNRSGLLERAIESVLAQSYPNVELLICDDGSSDNTKALLNKFKELHSNLVVLRNEVPQGACVARNKCIEAAQGKFITGLDDDDVFHPERLTLLFEHFDEKNAFVCDSNIEEDLSVSKPSFGTNDNSSVTSEIVTLKELLDQNVIGNQVFTLTSRLRGIDGFDPEMPAWQDYDTWVRLTKAYGSGLKLSTTTYCADIDRSRRRISLTSNRYKGCVRFYEKFSGDLLPYQKRNAEVRKYLIGGEDVPLVKLLSFFNVQLYKFWLKAVLIKLKVMKA
jgi:glycosyltransferase involved in cell wall biosynthesis